MGSQSILLRLFLVFALIQNALSGPALYFFCVGGCTSVCSGAVIIGTGGWGTPAVAACVKGCVDVCLIAGIVPTP
ncbi:unnamed protein product, partial [Mesorhabditis belari]|uniref:Uncharacterized protein n=1 Tax=Mesorhabditis belari TaxID=2138241 RepID=A0AAF3EK89_9BILA